MNVRLATSEDNGAWDNFIFSSPHGSFLQSWAWGEMQRGLGVPFWRLIAEDENKISAVALVLKRELPLGRSWLYVPRGPTFAEASAGKPDVWQELQKKLSSLAHEQKAIFIRIDPAFAEASAGKPAFLGELWRKADHEVQPQHTIILDLTKSDEELLAAMHPKTRYNISLAAKKGVTVRWSMQPDDIEKFLAISHDVMKRSDFRYHPSEYYRAMARVLVPDGLMVIELAEYQSQVLAAHLMMFGGETATYVHGASSSRQRQLMAPYLLQWEAMKLARQRGCRQYDLFGVAPTDAVKHLWAGITRFKEGFGGSRVDYIGAYDLIIESGPYIMFNLARRVRMLVR